MGRTVLTLLAVVGSLLALGVARSAAQDLDAGKSPGQLFNNSCTACHRGPQGLGAGRDPRTVASFLAQHYTSSRSSAAALAGYLAGMGGDPRAARARSRAEPADVGPRPAQQATPAQPPGRAAPQADPQASGAVAARTPDPEEGRTGAARERQKRRERREALEAERQLKQQDAPARRGLPSVSSDPPPPVVSALPVPMPAAIARPGAQAAATPALPAPLQPEQLHSGTQAEPARRGGDGASASPNPAGEAEDRARPDPASAAAEPPPEPGNGPRPASAPATGER